MLSQSRAESNATQSWGAAGKRPVLVGVSARAATVACKVQVFKRLGVT
jgi:hypothetical protein